MRLNQKTALLIHFNDLRLTDNRALAEAISLSDVVYALVVIDVDRALQGPCGIPKMSARRLDWYLKGVTNLRESYRAIGGDLIVRLGRTDEVVKDLVSALGVTVVYGQQAKTTEELTVRHRIEEAVMEIPCHWRWNDVLIEPNELPVGELDFPMSFSKFRKEFERPTVPQ